MLAQHQEAIAQKISKALEALGVTDANVALERPKNPEHGDIACNVAMQLARQLKKNPREIANQIVESLLAGRGEDSLILSAEVAGPGFINIRLDPKARFAIVRNVLETGAHYGESKAHEGESVLLEFVSANPTGPLHLGHARQGALGDVLANILATQGWAVTREFYYNDAGVQIGNLAKSIELRGRELQGEKIEFPENAYHGEYIYSIARDYLAKKPLTAHDGQVVEASGDLSDVENIRRYGVAYLRNEQDDDLAALGVKFDNFYLESSLYKDGRVKKTVDAIIESGRTYEKDGALWLKTTDFADLGVIDDKDRVMKKADGTYTYFVPDVAYHIAKFERGHSRAVNIQGSDHHGTVARVRCGLQAAASVLGLKIPVTFPEYILHKMLSVVKDGEPVKMSKRSGNYVTLRDLVDMAGRDAARYFLVSRKADAEFVFDINLAREKSDENPVYYLQYAHARICSVFANAGERGYAVPSDAELARVDMSSLESEQSGALINKIAEYPAVLEAAARDNAPHSLCYYLKDLAATFHTFYNAERVLIDDEAARNARFALLAATRRVLANGFALLGIEAPEYMARREDE